MVLDQNDQQNEVTNSEEISLAEFANKFKSGISYVKSKWFIILIVSIVGGVIGFTYAKYSKPSYTAVCTFVLEESKNGGSLGQYAGLASLAGVNMGANVGGIFEGDNIIELYKSRTMIERALLSEIEIYGKKQKLIDRFISFNRKNESPEDVANIGKLKFEGDPQNFSRVQDSVITDLVDLFNRKILNVIKPDKKLNIIDVYVTSDDELFAKAFTNKLVETVNDFYVFTKTEKAAQNVRILQHQADSIKIMLNSSIHGVASAIDADPNANPLMSTLRETSQKRQVDVQANTLIYGEMVKNLELSKISLRQETPLIQVIDRPVLPLAKKKVGKLTAAVVGILICMFISIIYFFIKNNL